MSQVPRTSLIKQYSTTDPSNPPYKPGCMLGTDHYYHNIQGIVFLWYTNKPVNNRRRNFPQTAISPKQQFLYKNYLWSVDTPKSHASYNHILGDGVKNHIIPTLLNMTVLCYWYIFTERDCEITKRYKRRVNWKLSRIRGTIKFSY